MEYSHSALPEKDTPAAETGVFSHIEGRSFRGDHRLYLKETGDCLATFRNPKEAFRTASVVNRALKQARSSWRNDIPEQDTLPGCSS